MPLWMTKPQRLIYVLMLSAVFLVSAVWISRSQDYMVNGDFFESWLAGRAFWTGVDWYEPDSWGPAHIKYGNVSDMNVVYPFPPVFALVFAPLGLLPLPVAVVIWVFALQWLLTLSVIVLGRASGLGSEAKYLLPILAGVFLFRPAMVMLRNGQNGALFLLVLTTIALFWQRGHWFSGGFILAFLLLRPNIGLPLVGMVGLWLLLTRKWHAIGGVFSGVVCLLLISQIMTPTWIEPWLGVGNNKLLNTFGYHPNLWGLVGWFSDHDLSTVIWMGSAMALAVTGVTALWLRSSNGKSAPLAALALAIPVGMFITPYMWAYDQVLLIFSIVVCTGELVKRDLPYLIPATLHILLSIAALALLAMAVAVGEDTLGGLLSLLVIGLVYATFRTRATATKLP
jgi:hypothetical protein